MITEENIKNIVSKVIKEQVDQEIAKTIIQQLGGNKFVVMTGAKNFVAINNGIKFNIGRNASRANLVKIILFGDDTYTMQFWRIGNSNPYITFMKYIEKGMSPEEAQKKAEKAKLNEEPKLLKEYNGLFFDQLQEFFTEYTKLYTHL